jgi:hypothetical protein
MTTLDSIRQKVFSDRKVICTGNPDQEGTIANAVKTLFPNATFIHLTNGWDLTRLENDVRLTKIFGEHNTFINASYIGPYVQNRLLDVCRASVKFCDVFNIGSTHEYDGLGTEEYKQSKLDLRNKSLAYNTFRFKTHHIIVGLIGSNGLTVDQIVSIITWIINQEYNIPLIAIDQPKDPW